MPPKKRRPTPTAALAAVKKKREAEAVAREAAAAAAAEDVLSEAAADDKPAVDQQPPPPMTADEIATALEAEGLMMLLPSRREGAKTGYKGVYPNGSRGDIHFPYVAELRRDGRQIMLGKFPTAAVSGGSSRLCPRNRSCGSPCECR